MAKSPCFECDRRTPKCHSYCSDYDIFLIKVMEIRKARQLERDKGPRRLLDNFRYYERHKR